MRPKKEGFIAGCLTRKLPKSKPPPEPPRSQRRNGYEACCWRLPGRGVRDTCVSRTAFRSTRRRQERLLRCSPCRRTPPRLPVPPSRTMGSPWGRGGQSTRFGHESGWFLYFPTLPFRYFGMNYACPVRLPSPLPAFAVSGSLAYSRARYSLMSSADKALAGFRRSSRYLRTVSSGIFLFPLSICAM